MFAMNDGIRICYDVVGKGVPLVLQHGSPQDSDDWRQSGYVGRLSERFQVVLIDARAEAAVRSSYENARLMSPQPSPSEAPTGKARGARRSGSG